MALHRILVVDDSPAVRETVGILLGGDYEVQAVRVDDYLAKGIDGPLPRVIIAARAASRHGEPGLFPAGIPVLWIDDDAADTSPRSRHGPSLPRRFSPRELRRCVAELLAAPPARANGPTRAARLYPPYVSSDAARAIARALSTELPLHLVGEPGIGKGSIARAVHAVHGSGTFLALEGAHFDAAVLTTPGRLGGTLFIDRAEQLDPAAQQALLAALEPTGLVRLADGGAVRLVSSASVDLGTAADAGSFTPDLY